MPTLECVTESKGTPVLTPYLLCACLAVSTATLPSEIASGCENDSNNHPVTLTSVNAQWKAGELQHKFDELALQWRNERGARASVADMAMLPAYQKIIGMGKDAIPMILTELKAEGHAPDHWFWALAAITQENPVPPKSRGKMVEMANAWLEWGQKEGHV
jgi:hypothetical protein